MLRVSLIMTTYNSKDNFIKSYESIRQQTWPDIEVVVVDGASTDGTKEEIEKRAKSDSSLRWISETGGHHRRVKYTGPGPSWSGPCG